MWWGFFLDRPQEGEVFAFIAKEIRRFRRIGGVTLVAVALTAPHLFWLHGWAVRAGEIPLWLAGLSALVLACLSTAWLLWRSRPEDIFQQWPVRLSWASLVLALILTALLDARITFPYHPSAWMLRPLHLLAFALRFGGALWNIFIAVPAAQEILSLPVVVSSARHLERFRRTVRVILPTLLITGLLQALPYTSLSLRAIDEHLWATHPFEVGADRRTGGDFHHLPDVARLLAGPSYVRRGGTGNQTRSTGPTRSAPGQPWEILRRVRPHPTCAGGYATRRGSGIAQQRSHLLVGTAGLVE